MRAGDVKAGEELSPVQADRLFKLTHVQGRLERGEVRPHRVRIEAQLLVPEASDGVLAERLPERVEGTREEVPGLLLVGFRPDARDDPVSADGAAAGAARMERTASLRRCAARPVTEPEGPSSDTLPSMRKQNDNGTPGEGS